jgi:nucleotide-binding universal stress UspA family protein
MTEMQSGATVVVGIDGSLAAVHAALWAVDEAIDRDVPLRLVHVIRPESETPSTDPVPLGVEYAESVLREADAAILATGKSVKVETAMSCGDPTTVLLDESRNAELICVGSVGIGVIARTLLGSKAMALAEAAHCPVAIIREHAKAPRPGHRWIVLAVKASTDDEDLVVTAMEEARLRNLPVLAIGLWQEDFGFTPYDQLDRLVQAWRQRYPDVDVHPVTTRSGLAHFLADEGAPIDLVVVGADEAGRVAQMIGPHDHPILGHPECSVLIVRH